MTRPLLQESIDAMVASHAGQRTTVIVAHRLSTVQKCDFIVVLSKGVVAESGTHDVLLHKKQVTCPSIPVCRGVHTCCSCIGGWLTRRTPPSEPSSSNCMYVHNILHPVNAFQFLFGPPPPCPSVTMASSGRVPQRIARSSLCLGAIHWCGIAREDAA